MTSFTHVIAKHQQIIDSLPEAIEPIGTTGKLIVSTFKAGNRLFLCGNGGSAADSQQIAAEFMMKYVGDKSNSDNVLATVDSAKRSGIKTIGMTGQGGGQLADKVDILVTVPSKVTARIQEAHILIGHWWCELADQHFKSKNASG